MGLQAEAFQADAALQPLAEVTPLSKQMNWVKQAITIVTAAYIALHTPKSDISTSPSPTLVDLACPPPPIVQEYTPETKLPNGITIHGSDNSEAVRRQAQVCNEFPSIFQDNGTFVDLPEEEWMKIDLKPG